jgi:CheY-like chemotaxis protein
MAHVGLLEDNSRIAKLIATMLHYAGHQVTVYEHPLACLSALLPGSNINSAVVSTQNGPYTPVLPVDVLILDLHLPKIDDGVEVLRRLQAYPLTRSLPLIFCTAATNSEVARALSVAPKAGVVEKPFKVQTLISAVASVLKPA